MLSRFIILVYQVIFFTSSLQGDGLWVTPGSVLAVKHEQLYYWWQYLWVSLILLSLWFIDLLMQVRQNTYYNNNNNHHHGGSPSPILILTNPFLPPALFSRQIFPPLSSIIFSSDRNVYFRTLVRIIWPQSRNYTGKDVQESMMNVMVYSLFWGPLLAWKFYFSYQYEIMPNALPSLELSDDLQNYPDDHSIWGTVVLIVSRWLPFLMIYMLDSLIWYSVWAGTTGLIVGLDEKLGEIRDFDSIRQNFMKTPEGFASR